MTAILVNGAGTKRVVLDGEIVVGERLDFGPLPDARAYLSVRPVSEVGGYPADYVLNRANHTGQQASSTVSDFAEAAQDAVGGILVDSATLDFDYTVATPSITAGVKAGSIANSHIAAAAAIDWTKVSKTGAVPGDVGAAAAVHTHTASNITDFSEAVDDRMATTLQSSAHITVTYNDAANTITILLGDLDFSGEGTLVVDAIESSTTLLAGEGNFATVRVSTDLHTGTAGIAMGNLTASTAPFTGIPATATVATNLDADKLDGQHGTYYRDADNLNAGTVDLARGGTNTDNTSITANFGLFGPTSGGAGNASFRAPVAADIPSLLSTKISDFIEAVQDVAGAMATDSASIDFTYDDTAGTLTAAVITEAIQDIVGAFVAGSTNITVTYNDASNTLTVSLPSTISGNTTFSNAVIVGTIRRATADASDNSMIEIGGGGDTNPNRGATLNLYGNEHSTQAGKARIIPGTTGTFEVLTSVSPSLIRFTVDQAGNVVIGAAALATTATDGFLYIPTCAGAPTGVPTAKTGMVPIVFDTTNNKFYIYDGSWLGGTTPGAFV